MLDVVNSVVEKVGITPDQADGALRIIINFLHADGPSETVASMAQELGIAHYIGEATPRGGLLGALGGLLGSGGGAMAAFGQLQSLGLNFGQIQAVVRHLIDIGRSKIGNEEVDRIVAAIPGLSQIVCRSIGRRVREKARSSCPRQARTGHGRSAIAQLSVSEIWP